MYRRIRSLTCFFFMASLAACSGGSGSGSGSENDPDGPDGGSPRPAACERDGDCAAGQVCDRSGQSLTAAPIGQSSHGQTAECVSACVPECEAAGESNCESGCQNVCTCIAGCETECEADGDCFETCFEGCLDGAPEPEPEPDPEPPVGRAGVCRDVERPDPEPEPEPAAAIDWAGNWTVDLEYDVRCDQGFNDIRNGSHSHTLTLAVRATDDGFEASVDSHRLAGTGNDSRLILTGALPLRDNNGHPATYVQRDTMVTLRIDDVIDGDEARGTVSGTYPGRFGSDCSVEGGAATLLR